MQILKSFVFSIVLFPVLALADGAAIVTSLEQVDRATTTLNDAVASWSGSPLTLLPILVDSTQLLSDTNGGTKTAEESAELTDAETIALLAPTNDLAAAVNNVVDTLIAAKPKFQRDFLTGTILLTLKAQQKASSDFESAIIAKVPAALQPTAEALVAPIDTALARAVAAYS